MSEKLLDRNMIPDDDDLDNMPLSFQPPATLMTLPISASGNSIFLI